jgi:predicted NAD/FAD-dependent oxidoreductase
VAIIGGGVSGLACAKALIGLGLDPTVYDTGNHAPGGRSSTRVLRAGEGGPEILFDHSAQVGRLGGGCMCTLVYGTEWLVCMDSGREGHGDHHQDRPPG